MMETPWHLYASFALLFIAITGGVVWGWIISLRERAPDQIVGEPKKPRTYRWFLFRRPWLQIVLHRHVRSDVPVLHDHSWWNVSIVLRGHAIEHLPRTWRLMRRVTIRRATDAHWIELCRNRELWTLFITGRESRVWGYWINGRWRRWDRCNEVAELARDQA